MYTPDVLLIDDDMMVLETVSLMVRSLGLETATAMNADALRQADLHRFRCIILDLWLSDSYGEESLEILTEKSYRGAVILISGKTRSEINHIARQGLEAGLAVIGYCQKPISKGDITQLFTRIPALSTTVQSN
ncbi:MAG: hypothetical protein PsegKO_25410 [Pseudohongiellaceae bacterium]|jgi:FixJ family two-component response regulator